MKKLIAYFLVLVMCFGMLAGCTTEPDEPVTPDPVPTPAPTPTPDPAPAPAPAPTAEDYLADAKAYVFNMYKGAKDQATKVLRDFDVVASVKIDSFTYDIAWTTNVAEDQVKLGAPASNKITVDLNENPGEEDLVFALTATLKAGSKTEAVTFDYYVPGTPAKVGGPVWVAAPEVGTAYKFALTQAKLDGTVLYFTGAMSGNYLATSTNPADAVDVTVEEVDGGYRLFFMDGETKMYIDIHEYAAGKAGVRLTAEPSATFVWNVECKVYTANVAGADRYLGTYSTYNTMSASEIKYIAGDKQADVGISQFPAGFCTVEFKVDKVSGQPAAGTTAKFYLTQAKLDGKNLYFAGAMSGNYLATTTNPFAAPDVTVEEVDGGFRLSFMDGETKMYIDIHEYAAGKAGVRLTAEPSAVFVWNEECGVFTANVAGADRYLGTYNTYNTISASEIKYIAGEKLGDIGVSQFPCFFGSVAYEFTPVAGQPAEGTAAKFALTQAKLDGKVLYFAGVMNGSYLATTTNPMAAPDVTVEAVEGGFRFFFMDGEVKTYIDIWENAEGKVRVRLTAEPTATFVWNEECKVFTANVSGADRYLGTYNTYNTISPSEIKYIAGDKLADIGVSQFPCYFGTAVPAI